MRFRETVNGTTWGDRILLVLLLALSFTGFILVREVLPQNREVIIEVDGKAVYRYPIDRDRVISVNGSHGTLTVEIHDRKVRVRDASCPNRLCELQGWTSWGGIICLPNKVSIMIGGPEKPDGNIDAITG